jgi:uncharacterized protein YjiS (DUF1127 family)
MLVAFFLSKVANYRRYRRTIFELSHFSDRELDDVGLSRSQVYNVSRKNAGG